MAYGQHWLHTDAQLSSGEVKAGNNRCRQRCRLRGTSKMMHLFGRRPRPAGERPRHGSAARPGQRLQGRQAQRRRPAQRGVDCGFQRAPLLPVSCPAELARRRCFPIIARRLFHATVIRFYGQRHLVAAAPGARMHGQEAAMACWAAAFAGVPLLGRPLADLTDAAPPLTVRLGSQMEAETAGRLTCDPAARMHGPAADALPLFSISPTAGRSSTTSSTTAWASCSPSPTPSSSKTRWRRPARSTPPAAWKCPSD